jgi:hypothetical protein
MADPLDKYTKYAGAISKIGKAIGPFLISQSQTASEKLAEHKNRQAQAEA